MYTTFAQSNILCWLPAVNKQTDVHLQWMDLGDNQTTLLKPPTIPFNAILDELYALLIHQVKILSTGFYLIFNSPNTDEQPK
jgi:hypothetical protein